MKALGEAVCKVARPLLGKRGFGAAELLADWPAIVGEELARSCVPSKLRFPDKQHRTGGTLHLRVAPGAGLEIQHQEPQLLERINSFCGYRAVARLVLHQGTLPPESAPPPPPRPLGAADRSALDARLAGIEDPELRAALERLGRAVLGERRR